MKTEDEVIKYLGEVQAEYDALSAKGGKDSPVDTHHWLRRLGELSAKIEGLKWVLNLK
jgi:hypothetical protein